MASSVRKNTVKFDFGPVIKVPSHLEVFKFCVDNLNLSVANIHSIYKEENGGRLYVKIVGEATFSAFLAGTDEGYSFIFEDGSAANVHLKICIADLQYVLGKYGTIRQHVRGRFPSEMKINIFTGVRGVHMEVSQEIPAHLYISHFRARIYYDGLKNKCFFCKAEGHVKAACPKLAVPGGLDKGTRDGSGSGAGSGSGVGVASGSGSGNSSGSLGRPSKPIIDRSNPKSLDMTNLNSLKAKKNDTTPAALKSNTTSTTKNTATPARSSSKPESAVRSTTETSPITDELDNDAPEL